MLRKELQKGRTSGENEGLVLADDPLWYKDAIVYEVPVRAFHDSVGDGMGDFAGLTQKLDYIQDLGITAIWLLPFYPSPLKDDGYDIADYTNIHPNHGVLKDFQILLREAHARGIRVITELVINHTSDQHPWFQRARRSPPGSPERDFYVWSEDPHRYKDARIIFKDFESSNWSWDPVANAYYWHRFYSHQPDLNYDNPAVQQAILPVLDFWMEMGVDGMRLDAIPYLYEREGTNCENLPETHAFLRKLRAHVDARFPNRMLLAEANQWPEDAVAYFGQGDECHTAFHFPLMPRMFMAIHTEDRFPIIDILQQTPPIPETCQWMLFLRNHDELTLEMVTDEERDYMYRAYATDRQARINLGIRRRLAPLLGNNRRRIELMNALLFSLPGTPVLYYGDEIGMGDNIYLGDRNGVRTPMQWSADRNAGFSRANAQKLYLPVIIDPEYHYESINVEAQQNNPNSLLWWMKRLIALRKRYTALGRGAIEFLFPENRKILAFLRRHGDEIILVVANLSRVMQHFELNLAEFQGKIPVELIGRVEFPPVGRDPYFMMLGPHSFCWFALETPRIPLGQLAVTPPEELPVLRSRGTWERLIRSTARGGLADLLPRFLQQRRWFGAKDRHIRDVTILDAISIPLRAKEESANLLLIKVEYMEGDPDQYFLPLAFAGEARARTVLTSMPQAAIARVEGEPAGVLYDALWDSNFSATLRDALLNGQTWGGEAGQVVTTPSGDVGELLAYPATALSPQISKGEQSNTSIIYGDRLILKLFRRLEPGVSPELEIGEFLTQRAHFPHTPALVGSIEYQKRREEPITLGVLQRYVANEGTAWEYTLDALGSYYERALTNTNSLVEGSPGHWLDDLDRVPLAEGVNGYLESARRIGQRTAEMHLALASESERLAFTPEPFSAMDQRSVYQSFRTSASQICIALGKRLKHLPEELHSEIQSILDAQGEILKRFRTILSGKISAMRIRCHGDYHLGQLLYTGKDFVIIDFEGEPTRSLGERRLKRSPLRDVAGMIRSFHYAAYVALFGQAGGQSGASGMIRRADEARLEPWAQRWYECVTAAFLRSYLEVAEAALFLPQDRQEFQRLLEAFLLEKAMYELGYELGHRPFWIKVPVRGILNLLQQPQRSLVS